MHRVSICLIAALAWMAAAQAWAADGQRAQLKGLDEQVQEIKGDVLGIAAELTRLEEKLLFPSGTQISLFVTLEPSEKFRLDAVDIQLDGKPVAHHVYSFKELEALQQGGVQRIYTGNITSGEHQLQVTAAGKSEGGAVFRHNATAAVTKEVGPRLVEIRLAAPSAGAAIEVKAW